MESDLQACRCAWLNRRLMRPLPVINGFSPGLSTCKHIRVSTLKRCSRMYRFKGLEPYELARIARGTREVNAARGDLLFHNGDPSNGFHLVVYGQIKLAFTSSQGGEKVVDIIAQGQSFGEAVMFMEKPYRCHPFADASRNEWTQRRLRIDHHYHRLQHQHSRASHRA